VPALGFSTLVSETIIHLCSTPNFSNSRQISEIHFIQGLSKFDALKFRNDLGKLPCETLKHYDDPENLWNTWKNTFLSVADQHAPPKTKRVRQKASRWLTRDITACTYCQES